MPIKEACSSWRELRDRQCLIPLALMPCTDAEATTAGPRWSCGVLHAGARTVGRCELSDLSHSAIICLCGFALCVVLFFFISLMAVFIFICYSATSAAIRLTLRPHWRNCLSYTTGCLLHVACITSFFLPVYPIASSRYAAIVRPGFPVHHYAGEISSWALVVPNSELERLNNLFCDNLWEKSYQQT